MKQILSFLTSRMFIFFALIGVQVWFLVTLLYDIENKFQWIETAVFVGSLLLALWVANKDVNPGYKIAWLLLILIMPVLGITMYFLFSQKKFNSEERALSAKIYNTLSAVLIPDEKAKKALGELSPSALVQTEYIDNASKFPVYQNTDLKYYPFGEPFYEDLLAALKSAKRFIYMEYFIIERGVMWDSILEILEQKAEEGLDVRLIYDDFGCISKLPPHYYRVIESKGIKVLVFNPLRPVMNSLFNNRDHRKITVIDNEIAFCGGANLADEYINAIERFGKWKDASIRIHGSATRSFLLAFLHIWSFITGEEPNLAEYNLERTFAQKDAKDVFVHPFADYSPIGHTPLAENIYLNIISRATKYVYINTPYLVLDDRLESALKNAAKSGVDVRITVPNIPDKKVVYLITQANFAPLIKSGVKIYKYTPGFIHSKTFVCDDAIGIVGTINLDYRSLYLNFECGVWYYDKKTALAMKEDYLDTVKQSHEVTKDEIIHTNVFKRFMQSIFKVFGPLM